QGSQLRPRSLLCLLRSFVFSFCNWHTLNIRKGVIWSFTHVMTTLSLSYITSLVELPSSYQNLNKLRLQKSGDSSNRHKLQIAQMVISVGLLTVEEFSKYLRKHEKPSTKFHSDRRVADFSNCGALTEAGWDDNASVVAIATENIHFRLSDKACSSLPDVYFSKVELNFFGCFIFDHKVLFQQQIVLMRVILSGEEVPSYFTDRTTENSLTNIPLPHISQPLLRFKACVLCHVCFRFIDIFGNHFDYADLPKYFTTSKLRGHLFILDCCFPTSLADQLNYDRVDLHFRIEDELKVHLKGCGILLSENVPSLGCNPNILPHVSGENTCNNAYLEGHETDHIQECGDSAMESDPSFTCY
ncbi:unnamed protein product, partial [Brassica rapa subsp. trilocularis]